MTASEMRVLELNAVYLGVSLGTLMENAGREVARSICSIEKVKDAQISILCGVGGNGGDGMVAARYLQEAGASVQVMLIGDPLRISSEDTQRNWNTLERMDTMPIAVLNTETAIRKEKSVLETDILIDALLGFGLTSRVREPIESAIRLVNKSTAAKYSIDVPSGMNSDTGKAMGVAVKADYTITLHAPKPGFLTNPELTGKLLVVPIGIPEEAKSICGLGDLWLFNRPRPLESKKGDYGRILIVGGSDVYSGAPALAGLAALRSGADLVTIMAPDPVVPAIRSYGPNLMVQNLGTSVLDISSLDVVLDAAMKNDVIALGPGMGVAKESISAFKEILEGLASLGKPLVVDADGLKALAQTTQRFESDKTVLTPHWGELQILLGKKIESTYDSSLRIEHAVEASKKYEAVILLKGAVDVIANPEGKYKLNKTGCPAMTVGGTGDVLTGITSAFLARNLGAFNAACAAAHVSGLAGEMASCDFGGRILATDCIERIPLVMKP